MVDLVRNGQLISRHETRAQAYVAAFEQGLVHDSHARGRRNTLLPGVKVNGVDGDYVETRYEEN